MLAEYAVKVENSRGRRHAEPLHPYRNDYQRDRDRIIHARAFRRLENKTQVFTRRFSDHFRNRLTHTIEVTQISRTIAGVLGLNTELVEALALVHDIGHPPFGHSGETALDEAMRRRGKSFNHNLHALRIVEDFEQRYASFRGLNLTFEVREGIIKHSCDWDEKEYPQLAEYLLDERPPLEAQLIDHTDEIAYNTADLDDGYEAHILELDDIRANVGIFRRCWEQAEKRFPGAADKLIFNEALKAMMDCMVTDLVEATARRVREAGVKTLDDVRGCRKRLAGFSAEVDAERREAKAYLYRALYDSDALRPEKARGAEIVSEMFEYLMAHPEQLPNTYRVKVGVSSLERVVCDYVAGMTDGFIFELHERLLGGAAGDL